MQYVFQEHFCATGKLMHEYLNEQRGRNNLNGWLHKPYFTADTIEGQVNEEFNVVSVYLWL